MSDTPSPWVAITSGELTAEIDPLGAQLSRLRDGRGHDLLWNGDPAIWSGRAPLLFPIVGELAGGRYRLGPATYELPRHGFARRKPFDIVRSTADSVSLSLRADAGTLAVYPFPFELDVHFTVKGSELRIMACVRNAGSSPMPASFGYHPGLRWPLPYGRERSSHFIEFANEEPGPVRRLDARGLLTPIRHPTPITRRRLALSDALFEEDVIIFDELRSRSVVYGADDGPRIRVTYPDSPYLGLWTKPGSSFICIEPWHGVADPVGFSGDFTHKPGVFTVAPGAAEHIDMRIALLTS